MGCELKNMSAYDNDEEVSADDVRMYKVSCRESNFALIYHKIMGFLIPSDAEQPNSADVGIATTMYPVITEP